jgi:hypothetical protein
LSLGTTILAPFGVRCQPVKTGAHAMSDKSILDHISALVEEEHKLRDHPSTPGANKERIQHIEEQLDQCWDLLRQRRARREFGEDPAAAKARDVKTVEGYEG